MFIAVSVDEEQGVSGLLMYMGSFLRLGIHHDFSGLRINSLK